MRENIFYIFVIVTLTFDFYTSNLPLVALVQHCVSTKLVVSTAFLF